MEGEERKGGREGGREVGREGKVHFYVIHREHKTSLFFPSSLYCSPLPPSPPCSNHSSAYSIGMYTYNIHVHANEVATYIFF